MKRSWRIAQLCAVSLLAMPLVFGGMANAATTSPPVVDIQGTQWVEVSTASQLLYIDANQSSYLGANTHVALMNSLHFPSGSAWSELGSNANPFRGVFNGQGYTISGLTVTADNEAVGFFGEVAGTVENLNVTDTVNGSSKYNWSYGVGGLVGWLNSGAVLKNVSVTGSVTGTYPTGGVGGLVGYSQGTVNNAFVKEAVTGKTGSSVGGLVGEQNGGSITDAYARGTVGGFANSPFIGPFIGSATNGSSMTACFYEGSGVNYGYSDAAKGVTNPTSATFTDVHWSSPPWTIPATGWPTFSITPTIRSSPQWAPPSIMPVTVTVNGHKAEVIGSLGYNAAQAIQNGTYRGYAEERAALASGITYSGEGTHSAYLSAILDGSGVGSQEHVSAQQQGEFAAIYQKLGIIPTWTNNTISIPAGVASLSKAGAPTLAIENYLVQMDGFSWSAAEAQAESGFSIQAQNH